MAFVSGPRQVGKTTLSKQFQTKFDQFLYRNWDESTFRKDWTKSPRESLNSFRFEKVNQDRLFILDEIHKSKNWKQKIKGLYDEYQDDLRFIVTGSAQLNVFKKGGDSLMGRYINFRLHPFSYGELVQGKPLSPQEWIEGLSRKPQHKVDHKTWNRLKTMGGFPEPYLADQEKILRIWRQGRNEKIVREDLRDLSRLPELSQIEMLTSLLPSKVGSPLSVTSLKEDLEVAHDTVKRWLQYLKALYYFFELKPWTKSIARTIKKEGKIYLFDWTELESEGARFENIIAAHLLKACHFWTDTGEGFFELHYVRNKEKEEIDFLLTRDRKPWLLIEAKSKETQINNKVADRMQGYLKCPFVQVVDESECYLKRDQKILMSAPWFLHGLP